MPFNSCCKKLGVIPTNVPADDKWHVVGLIEKPSSDAGRIMMFSDGSGGIVYNWILCENSVFWYNNDTISPSEQRERDKKRKEAIQKADHDKKIRATIAAKIAKKIYNDLAITAKQDHPYLVKKQIPANQFLSEILLSDLIKELGYTPHSKNKNLVGRILVAPIANCHEITSLAMIDESGRKAFLAGGVLSGGFWLTGKPKNGDPVFIAEGIATAITISTLTGCVCVSAMSAGGFATVVPAIKKWLTDSQIIVCADVGNGFDKANIAAKTNGCVCITPLCDTGTDFNDMMAESGDNETKSLLLSAILTKNKNAGIIKMSNLVTMELPPMRWLVEGLIPEGCTILAGAPKIGKSWLALDMLLTVTTPERKLFAEYPCPYGTALYLALEDSLTRLQDRTKTIIDGLLPYDTQAARATDRAHCVIDWPVIGAGCIEQIEDFISDNPDTRLIIVDTLARVRPATGKSAANAYEIDYAIVGQFQKFALKYHVAVILVTHLRKSTGREHDPFEEVTGSMGISGAADATIVFKRGKNSDIGDFYIRGRDVEEKCLKLKNVNGVWFYLGNESDEPKYLPEIKTFVSETNKREFTPSEFNKWYYDNMNEKISGIWMVLKRLYEHGHLRKMNNGKYSII